MSPLSLLRALGLAGLLLLALSGEARAEEATECPSCWRMIQPGPCRCPHCQGELPGRVCGPEEEPERAHDEAVEHGEEPEQGPTKGRETRSAEPRPRQVKRRPPASSDRPTASPPAKRRPRPPSRSASEERADRERPERPQRREPLEARASFDSPERPAKRPVSRPRPRPPVEEDDEDDEDDRSPPPRRPRGDRDEGDRDEGERDEALEHRWRGPSFLIGYRYFGLYDWTKEGHSHALTIEGFPVGRYVPWLRVGLGLDVGFRTLERHVDWTMRGYASLGVQYPRRVSPYFQMSIGGGTAYQKRFGQSETHGMWGLSLEAGSTFMLSRTFALDLGVGYMYMSFNDLGYHSATVRVGIGW